MPSADEFSQIIRFGAFQTDLRTGELWKNGRKVRLQEQPFRVLRLLIERQGKVVTRNEIQRTLWPDEEFGEFDQSLNTAVRKIRRALGDSADNPRFVETLPKHGYRFVAPVRNPTTGTETDAGPPQGRRRQLLKSALIGVGIIAVIAVSLIGFGWISGSGSETQDRLISLELAAPPGVNAVAFAISPDGRHLAFVGQSLSGSQIWIRSLDGSRTEPLPGTHLASVKSAPFWSPDSRSIGFFAQHKLKTISLFGESPFTVCDALAGRGGTWTSSDEIIFAPHHIDDLYRVPATGGTPVQFTTRDDSESSHRGPDSLPGGDVTLFWTRRDNHTGGPTLEAVSSDSGERRTLLDLEFPAVHARGRSGTDYLLYIRNGVLFARPLDTSGPTLKDRPLEVAHRVAANAVARFGLFSVSDEGTLVYYQEDNVGRKGELAWVDREGSVLRAEGAVNLQTEHFTLSPDKRRVLLQTYSDEVAGLSAVHVLDLDRGIHTLLDAGWAPHWSPDGTEAVYTPSTRIREHGLRRISAAGETPPYWLMRSEVPCVPIQWHPSGFLLFLKGKPNRETELWVRFPDGSARQWLKAETGKEQARLSADGRWISYCSGRSGEIEIYVRPFPEGRGRWQISQGGGQKPQWSPEGDELFYLSATGDLMTVSVTSAGSTFRAGTPEKLFPVLPGHRDYDLIAPHYSNYAVGEGGERFLVIRPTTPGPLTVVRNWEAAIRPPNEGF